MAVNLLGKLREDAGMTQDELARASGTSRTALSAYEHGSKSPRLDTVERIVAAAGRRLTLADAVEFVPRDLGRGRTTMVPVNLPRLAPERAFATTELPVHLNWSQPGRVFRLADRSDRARVYELVLTEGTQEDVTAYVDGALLVDLWNDLVLPRAVRGAWTPLIDDVVPVVA
ncbi:MAG: helix-turn-helix domain-containing protein [Actinobacteria bacterium]|nr:helix-turn-helix domain-containing protein [Actinomycetota bacterium]MCG2802801.1 helix-turn-helix domain-containing protein [Cellulomonas sp.]